LRFLAKVQSMQPTDDFPAGQSNKKLRCQPLSIPFFLERRLELCQSPVNHQRQPSGVQNRLLRQQSLHGKRTRLLSEREHLTESPLRRIYTSAHIASTRVLGICGTPPAQPR
jgi:hypothetical protein